VRGRDLIDLKRGVHVRERLLATVCLVACAVIAGCGGGGKVSSASLEPRLLPKGSIPGFGVQRTLDWTNPIDLVGEGLALPQVTHPSAAVKEFSDRHLRGAAGRIFVQGAGPEETAIRTGVAQFDSAADANAVRDWMHEQDLEPPCYGKCTFAPAPIAIAGIPNARFVEQSSRAPAPRGLPPGVTAAEAKEHPLVIGPAPANYLAEFTIGPYLYWAVLQAPAGNTAKFEAGLRAYYAHASQIS
jgi:hypothetical protein